MELTGTEEQVAADADRVNGELTCSPLYGLLISTLEDVDELVASLETVIVASVAQIPPLAFHAFTCTVWVPEEVETSVSIVDFPLNMIVPPLSME